MPLNDRESPEIREEMKLVSNEDVKAVLQIKYNNLNGNFLLKKKIFLFVFCVCEWTQTRYEQWTGTFIVGDHDYEVYVQSL